MTVPYAVNSAQSRLRRLEVGFSWGVITPDGELAMFKSEQEASAWANGEVVLQVTERLIMEMYYLQVRKALVK
jgi:hypothetical protein